MDLKIIKALIDKDLPLISNLSNVSSALNELENINWVGFYLVGDNYLYLGPFQGEIACNKIPFSQGVCGYAYRNKKTVIVPDVNEFKGHIACSTKSKSEIVVPIFKGKEVVALIDVDSPIIDRFHMDEQKYLEEISKILSILF